MASYVCRICNYVYHEDRGDPENGIAAGTKFEDLPAQWACPVCGAARDQFYRRFDGLKEESATRSTQDDIAQWDLTKVRSVALEKLGSVCGVHRLCDGHPNNVCMGQKYGRPLGFGGAGQGMSFRNNILSLAKIKLKTRLVSAHFNPDFSTSFLGHKISMPLLGASMSGANTSFLGHVTERDFARAMLEGCKEEGTLSLTGNSPEDGDIEAGIDAIRETGGYGIPIFKPQPNSALIRLIAKAEEAGALAVGVDLDGAGSFNWHKYGRPVERKTPAQLRELVASTRLPFMFKGIMTVEDAQKVMESGARVLGVSNHGGRVNDHTPGVAEVLPDIVRIARGTIIISADGGVRTGFDIIKMLALGADVVLMGRDLARGAIAAGSHGVRLHLQYVKADFRAAMIMTGCRSVADISPDVLAF
jgi:4-hydroxymandelate oxidase